MHCAVVLRRKSLCLKNVLRVQSHLHHTCQLQMARGSPEYVTLMTSVDGGNVQLPVALPSLIGAENPDALVLPATVAYCRVERRRTDLMVSMVIITGSITTIVMIMLRLLRLWIQTGVWDRCRRRLITSWTRSVDVTVIATSLGIGGRVHVADRHRQSPIPHDRIPRGVIQVIAVTMTIANVFLLRPGGVVSMSVAAVLGRRVV